MNKYRLSDGGGYIVDSEGTIANSNDVLGYIEELKRERDLFERECKKLADVATELDCKVEEPSYSSTTCLREEITKIINKHNAENESNTPDFILGNYLMDCLGAFDKATNARTKWFTPIEEQYTIEEWSTKHYIRNK